MLSKVLTTSSLRRFGVEMAAVTVNEAPHTLESLCCGGACRCWFWACWLASASIFLARLSMACAACCVAFWVAPISVQERLFHFVFLTWEDDARSPRK